MKTNTMDVNNTMTAIISAIMLGLGFIGGMVVTTVLDSYDFDRVHNLLLTSRELNKSLEHEVKYLRAELNREIEEKEEFAEKVKDLAKLYIRIPPPTGPLERCDGCSDSDSEDSEFECPISPDPVSGSKD